MRSALLFAAILGGCTAVDLLPVELDALGHAVLCGPSPEQVYQAEKGEPMGNRAALALATYRALECPVTEEPAPVN